MPLYHYRAIKDNKPYESDKHAADKNILTAEIKKDGATIIYIREASEKGFQVRKLLNLFGSVRTHEKITFARNLGAMIKAGLSVTRSLTVMEKQSKNKKLKKVLNDVSDNINSGKTLSDSMKEYPEVFSQLFISMVRAGEESGTVADSLKVVSSQMEKTYNLQKKIRGAMIYPTIIICVMIIIGVLMLIFVVPTLTETFKGFDVELPLSTRIIIGTSDFLRYHIIVALSGFIAALGLFITAFRTKKGKRMFDYFLIHAPLIGNLVKEVNSARTTRTLSSLLSAGVDYVIAVNITGEVLQNSYYKEVMAKAEKVIQKGDPISSVLLERDDLYPPFVGEMASVGEETGKLGEMLIGVATYYEDEVDQKTKDMSTIIEPVLMVLIGIVVGLFAISILAPTYSLVDKI